MKYRYFLENKGRLMRDVYLTNEDKTKGGWYNTLDDKGLKYVMTFEDHKALNENFSELTEEDMFLSML